MTLAAHAFALRTPLGATVESVAGAIAAGASAVRSDVIGKVAPLGCAPVSGRLARQVGPLGALAVEVAAEALAAAGRAGGDRVGVFAATGGLRAGWDELMPAMAEQRTDGAGAWGRGLARMHPLWMLRYLSNAAQGLIAAELGARGDGAVFAGSASAASALAAADLAIAAGAIDLAIVVAADTLLSPEVRVELARRRPEVIPGAGVVAVVVAGERGAIHLDAADGIDPDSPEPSTTAIARVRGRVPPGGRECSFAAATGHLGAAGPLCDAALAAHFARRGWPPGADRPGPALIIEAGAPGQIGVIRVEAT